MTAALRFLMVIGTICVTATASAVGTISSGGDRAAPHLQLICSSTETLASGAPRYEVRMLPSYSFTGRQQLAVKYLETGEVETFEATSKLDLNNTDRSYFELKIYGAKTTSLGVQGISLSVDLRTKPNGTYSAYFQLQGKAGLDWNRDDGGFLINQGFACVAPIARSQ